MATKLSSARVALRCVFSAAASPGLGAASPVGFQHGPLLRRLINSDASASTALKNKHCFTSESRAARDVQMDIKRRHEVKKKEFFHLLEEALKTADPAKAGLVLEKRKELSDLVHEYQANSGPKTAGRKALNFWVIVSAVVSGYFVASTANIIMSNR
uniref:Uncharacterized protein n=1 Tax=Oryza punctata TaxID=4537 RepID=A0A0E0L6B0_ORYPU